eukprot:2393512-Karenia_brevis.AAC.1
MSHFVERGCEEDARRLDDLRDPHQNHAWMFMLNPAEELVLPESDWLVAARMRLGCSAVLGEHVCACAESMSWTNKLITHCA